MHLSLPVPILIPVLDLVPAVYRQYQYLTVLTVGRKGSPGPCHVNRSFVIPVNIAALLNLEEFYLIMENTGRENSGRDMRLPQGMSPNARCLLATEDALLSVVM